MHDKISRSLPHRITAFLILLACAISPAQAGFELTVNLDGNAYIALLERNDALMNQIQDSNPLGNEIDQHYFGKLKDVGDSWVRISNIAGEWQGVVSAFQQKFVIEAAVAGPDQSRFSSETTDFTHLLSSKPISHYDHSETSCGLEDTYHGSVSALALPEISKIQQRSFNQLCADKVSDGNGGEICLIAELELAFDQDFQTAVGSDSASIATAIINVVDGFYRNDLNISFETLSRTMLTDANDIFTDSTSHNTLLEDIRSLKQADGIPFITNPNALFHFVTGRDFIGSTVGVAFLGVNCAKGSASGTSQLLGSGGNRIALTAAVIAHELGHNFGANHDIQNGSVCPTGFIMAPSVNANADEFSSCSQSDIRNYLGSIEDRSNRADLNACFNFPVDLAVAASGGNPSAVTKNDAFNSVFVLTPSQAIESISNATFSGSVNGGSIESVGIPGQSCTVAANQLSFNCDLTNFTASESATIEMEASADQLNLSLSTNVTGDDLRDIVADNNTLNVQISATGGGGSDSTPDQFTFADQLDVAKNQSVVSSPITVSGIDIVTDISVVGGEYSINNGAFTASVGSVVNGDSVRARHTSSVDQLTTVNTVLTIGGISDVFSSTTAANPPTDDVPDSFRFTDVDGVPLSSIQTSDIVVISGIDTASDISIVNGFYSINAQPFTSDDGVVVNGDMVQVQHVSSADAASRTDTTLTIGGISDSFSSTTEASVVPVDTTPDQFSFDLINDAALATEQTSDEITVSGINSASVISISGGLYSIDGSAFSSATSTVVNGNTVRLRHISASTEGSMVNTILTIGGVSSVFLSVTESNETETDSDSDSGSGSGGGSMPLTLLIWLLFFGVLLSKSKVNRFKSGSN